MTPREQIIRAEITRRGLVLIRRGAGWWICGRGVDVLVARLELIADRDLLPAPGFGHFQHQPLTEKKP